MQNKYVLSNFLFQFQIMAMSGSSLGLLDNPGGVPLNGEGATECDSTVPVEETENQRCLLERKNTLGRQKEGNINLILYI